MGQKLVNYYKKVEELGGMKAKMRMAMITALPSVIAKNQDDSSELLTRFAKAFKIIEKEYK